MVSNVREGTPTSTIIKDSSDRTHTGRKNWQIENHKLDMMYKTTPNAILPHPIYFNLKTRNELPPIITLVSVAETDIRK